MMTTSGDIRDIFAGALSKCNLDNSGEERLIKRRDELENETMKLITKLATVDQRVKEKFASDSLYPPEYKGPRPIEEQIERLATLFNLKPYDALLFAKELPELPEGAEGWFAIAKWERVCTSYATAVEQGFVQMQIQRKFYSYPSRPIVQSHLLERNFLYDIAGKPNCGDIFVIPAQFGFRHRGHSVDYAYDDGFMKNEFGLGAFAVTCMLLTHPEREVRWDQLHIDCAGDTFAPKVDLYNQGVFSNAPSFCFEGGGIE
ncbi:MAG: hypothetical protein Q7S18_01745, partial [bacterium]|nr:hypothetical protein [bacterium]